MSAMSSRVAGRSASRSSSVRSMQVHVLGFEPQNVTVDLDELGDKVVPVQVGHGEAPPDATLGTEEVDPTEAT